MRYASETTVSIDRSQQEILKNLRRYKADAFAFGEEGGCGIVSFRLRNLPIRFRLEYPERDEVRFTHSAGGRRVRSQANQEKVYEKACRQKWRALNLFILATLEAVESGIIPFEHAWMPYCLLADRRTVGEHFEEQVHKAIESGAFMGQLLLPGPARRES